jgi:hypothetical protein
MMMFAGGGIVSINPGISHLKHPRSLEHLTWGYLILAISAISEGTCYGSLTVSLGELSVLMKTYGRRFISVRTLVHSPFCSKMPQLFSV